MDGFHGGVKAHGPSPEQGSAFRCGSTVRDLFQLTLATITANRKDGRSVHGEQESRSIQEDD